MSFRAKVNTTGRMLEMADVSRKKNECIIEEERGEGGITPSLHLPLTQAESTPQIIHFKDTVKEFDEGNDVPKNIVELLCSKVSYDT